MAAITSTFDGEQSVLEPQLLPVECEKTARNVLVLEDDALQLQVLTHHLEALSFKVLAASTVREATHLLREHRLDMAILDITLPDGSGLEICEEIDSDASLAGLPTIVLSSRTEADLVRRTRASGASFFISKPYDPNVLLAIIERALELRVQ